eukprot:CAMPEP_0197002250 /NCGR_PEP_ID=MMETSP1380-20130617/6783_1 /TAXON_ID=5936 /ORGANISM="Euplotes crassus, Strain CT5" /LENGTH=39 /DNA_ID= /DNA_START= /DNA_END= /DNA_ORIENTATION=
MLDMGIIGEEDSFDSVYIVMEYVKTDMKYMQSREEKLNL